MCLYVELCEFECTCMHICIYVSTYVGVFVYLSMCMYIWLCVHMHPYTCMPVFLVSPPFLLHSLLTPLITEVAPHKAAGLLCLSHRVDLRCDMWVTGNCCFPSRQMSMW